MLIPRNGYLLIARKGGSSRSRRQRRFTTREAVDRAIVRWRKEGFDTWWLREGTQGDLQHWIDKEGAMGAVVNDDAKPDTTENNTVPPGPADEPIQEGGSDEE